MARQKPPSNPLYVGAILIFLAVFVIVQRARQTSEAKVAYFIQVSANNLALLPRLVFALYHAENLYALHFDLKIPEESVRECLLTVYQTLAPHSYGAELNIPNLFVVKSEAITYRGITMTMNYLTGSNFLLAKGDWDFFINLSGADYPTASQTIIRRLLATTRTRNFVEWKPRADWSGFAEKRLGEFYIDSGLAQAGTPETVFVSIDGKNVSKVSDPAAPKNALYWHLDYTLAKSSGWFILSREFCEAMRGDSFARKVLAALSFSDASDEHLYATVLWNNEWRSSVVPSNFRNIFFFAPNGSLALGEDGVRSRQHPFWVDDVDENGKLLFWDKLHEHPGFFTRKVRDVGSFRDTVDNEMLGLHGRSFVSVVDYEKKLVARFQHVVSLSQGDWEEDRHLLYKGY